ncbi:MAG TPA: hypothetical protein VEV44_07125 [Pseudoneobacillus sp.]|nr:hypothetical protein [Pseudoneobacillus sp.]
MTQSFKDAFRLYTGKFEGVFLLSLTIVLPLIVVNWLINNVVYFFVFNDFTSALADFYYIFLTFLILMVAQIPFIQLVKSYSETGEYQFKTIYYVFITTAFSVFVFAAIYSFLIAIGTLLFIIPGLIFMTFFFTTPHEAIVENKSVWKSWKTSFHFAKKKFFPLLIMILFISIVEVIIGWIGMYIIYSITNSLLAQIVIQMFLNLLIFPFLSIWVTYYFILWKEQNQLTKQLDVSIGS